MKRKTVKRIIIILLIIAILSAWGVGFYTVNSQSDKQVVKIYNTGDIVAIGDNFCQTANEDSNGYEFTVIGGTVKTTEQFLKDNGKEPDYLHKLNPKGFVPGYVYLLEVKVRNVGNTNQKGFSLVGMPLVTSNLQLQVHDAMFDILYPKLAGFYGFAVRPDTEMIMYLPYAATKSIDKYCNYDYLTSEQFSFVISWFPEEIRIKVETSV